MNRGRGANTLTIETQHSGSMCAEMHVRPRAGLPEQIGNETIISPGKVVFAHQLGSVICDHTPENIGCCEWVFHCISLQDVSRLGWFSQAALRHQADVSVWLPRSFSRSCTAHWRRR